MVIEKIVLKVGGKKIELTQPEYEELRQHFTKEYVPYPYPVYPQQPNWPQWPIITYTSGKTESTECNQVYFNA